jgi:hypothetical protein
MARKRTVLQRSAWLLDTPPIGRRNAAVAGLTSRRPQAPEDLPERVVFGCSRRTRSVRLWVIFPKTKTSYLKRVTKTLFRIWYLCWNVFISMDGIGRRRYMWVRGTAVAESQI